MPGERGEPAEVCGPMFSFEFVASVYAGSDAYLIPARVRFNIDRRRFEDEFGRVIEPKRFGVIRNVGADRDE